MAERAVIDVIVPVYDGYQETRACLESVLASVNSTPYHLLIIWDDGPDSRLHEYVRSLAPSPQIELIENQVNLGFVKTVNLAMAVNPQRDVVLLNSDTLVANNWLDRLAEAAASDDRVATVTPFSNNAEICSFPRFCLKISAINNAF